MNKRRGVLLLTVLLLSGVLLIFAASYLSSAASKMNTVSNCSEKEEAMKAVDAGLQAASGYLSENLMKHSMEDLLESKPYCSKWQKVRGGSAGDLEPSYRFRIDFQNRRIDAQGRIRVKKSFSAMKEDGVKEEYTYVYRHLRTLFVPEYLCVGADKINVKDNDSAAISSVYSYMTQFPLETWLLTKNGSAEDVSNALLYNGTLKKWSKDDVMWGSEHPISPLVSYNSKGERKANDSGDNMMKKVLDAMGINGKELSKGDFIGNRRLAIESVKKLRDAGFVFDLGRDDSDSMTFECEELRMVDGLVVYGGSLRYYLYEVVYAFLKTPYRSYVSLERPASWAKGLFGEIRKSIVTAGAGFDSDMLVATTKDDAGGGIIGTIDSRPLDGGGGGGGGGGGSGDGDGSGSGTPRIVKIGPFSASSSPSSNVKIESKNGSILLSSSEMSGYADNSDRNSGASYKFFRLEPGKRVCIVKPYRDVFELDGDLVLEDNIVVLTCSLRVKGNIRGRGMIVSANSVYFYPRNICYNLSGNEVPSFDPGDRLLVYADNKVYAGNPSTFKMEDFNYASMRFFDPVRCQESADKIYAGTYRSPESSIYKPSSYKPAINGRTDDPSTPDLPSGPTPSSRAGTD